ncbi:MAG: carbohydrate binding family 9 domain-containing protein [Acidobacteriota bacterium]|nr:carbohydrate binding family 9 domain-containing protein [Acidobacteriota bacterium]
MSTIRETASALWHLSRRSAATLAVIGLLQWSLVPTARVAASQQTSPTRPVRSAVVTAVSSAIVIDGVLDEDPWRHAPKIGALVQRLPEAGAKPTEKTDVTLLYDEDNLYIGVICYDSDPRGVLASQMARDARLRADDRLEIVLDTFRDQSNAFYFSTNPAGALVDGLVFANGETNNDWDAIWIVQTQQTDKGWTAEFAIPFKSLSFPAGETVWGFNISRTIQRKLEENRWTGARFQTQFVQVSEAGEITNLEGLAQGAGLDIRPFMAGRWLHRTASGSNAIVGKPGLDLFYNITPSLRLSVTANTDFGETEVDSRQINLTRFSIFFPEKRSFFLQDAGVFNFATTGVGPPGGIPGTGAEIFPFFSRKIGLLGGQEVPIDYGAKLTGKVGRTEIGMLDVRTRDVSNIGAKNLFVGRIKQTFLAQSYVGAIVTGGNPGSQWSSSTTGVDMRLATSNFLSNDQNIVFNAFALTSNNEGVLDNTSSYGFSAQYPNDKFDAQIQWREIQENFDPAIGFVQRSNVRMLRLAGSFNPRPRRSTGIQQMFHDVFYTRFTRLDNGRVESWNLYLTVVDWHLNSGDSLHSLFDANPTYEHLFEAFEISDGVVLPAGEYRFTPWRLFFTSAQKRRIQGSVGLSFGNFWSGTANMLQTGLRYNIPPRFLISFNTNQTFANLPQGNFIARIYSAQVEYAVSSLLSFSNLIQFDNRSEHLGLQSRVRWTIEPGNDVFFVFGQGWVQDFGRGYDFRRQDSKFATKLQYTLRF